MKISKLVWVGLSFLVVGFSPITLYSMFGPKDGNPIGLGLLAMAFGPIGTFFLLIGAIKTGLVFRRKEK